MYRGIIQNKHKLNTGAEIILAYNTYDELGRLKTSTAGNRSELKTVYGYNIRSWTKTITNPLFSQSLYYNESYVNNVPRYGGDITAMAWKVSGENQRTYSFKYDNLSRLVHAAYNNVASGGDYNTSYTYDKHGNITALVRRGKINATSFGTVDNLALSYTGNQLLKVTDTGTNVTMPESGDFKDYADTSPEYTFNKNGSMSKDLNKGILGINYNSLNLPRELAVKNTNASGKTYYTYSSDGRKLKTVHKTTTNLAYTPVLGSTSGDANYNVTKTTDYAGSIVYENGTLKRILVDGGYIEGGVYHFYLKDHLGNNRVVADASGTVIQKTHYYPFGAAFAEGTKAEQSKQPYKYGDKLLDDTHGLNIYDFEARYSDPALANRFWMVDPLAEKYYSISPYVYCANNPLKYVDRDGRELLLFKNGVYVGSQDDGKKEVTGFNQRSTIDKDGKEEFIGADNFSFNDIDLDRSSLENGSMTLSFVSSDDLNSVVGQSGVNDQSVLSGWGFTVRESNANNLSGEGKMDYRINPQISNENQLYVINGVGYNSADAGNYLWGYAMRTMGFSEMMARSAAHINAWWSAKQSNGEGSRSSWKIVRAFENRSWGGDSAADQRAIKKGMKDAGGYWKYKKQTFKKLWNKLTK